MGYAAIVIAVIIADQLTKEYITNIFQLFDVREIIPGFFNLVYVTNSGAAFSLLADVNSPWRHYFFLTIGVAAAIGISVAYVQLRNTHRLYVCSLGLIAGGAIGNLIDRVRYGAVVDFLDFHYGGYHWPAFNVADSAICVGAGLFLILNFLTPESNNQIQAKNFKTE